MATMSLQGLVDRVSPWVPKCPEPTILTALREAAVELCESSDAWQYQARDIPVVPGIDTYPVDLPANTEVVRVNRFATLGRARLEATSYTWLDQRRPYWQTQEGMPDKFVPLLDDEQQLQLRLTPMPATSGDDDFLSVLVYLKPTRASNAIDSQMFQRYQTDLMHGALAQLFAIPGKDWTDEKRADYYERKFSGGKAKARNDGLREFSNRSLVVEPPEDNPFA